MNTQHIQLKVPLSVDQLIDIVRQLSPKEKQKLSGVLWEETREEEVFIPEDHKKIVRQRLKRMDERPETSLNWEDIERKMKL
ncbi:MAG TPA: addiction module protein [Bacteroidales bacterium]|nr:addiction module protein [Bacteroidales bacterium]